MIEELAKLSLEDWRVLCLKMSWYYRSPGRPMPKPFVAPVSYSHWDNIRRNVKLLRRALFEQTNDVDIEERKYQRREYMRQYMRDYREQNNR